MMSMINLLRLVKQNRVHRRSRPKNQPKKAKKLNRSKKIKRNPRFQTKRKKEAGLQSRASSQVRKKSLMNPSENNLPMKRMMVTLKSNQAPPSLHELMIKDQRAALAQPPKLCFYSPHNSKIYLNSE